MINKAKWDSNYFKYPVGILNIKEEEEFNFENFKIASNKYKLVYIFSEVELKKNPQLKLIDTKITYIKNILKGNNFEQILEFNPQIHSFNELLKLAYLSGIYSRFKKDQFFSNNEFNILYKEWLRKSINNVSTYKTLVHYIDDKMTGFITLKFDDNFSEIGLIAVGEIFQEQNIGSALIKQCEFISNEYNHLNIKVSTQFENIPARRLYEKNEFQIENFTYIYHFWNL